MNPLGLALTEELAREIHNNNNKNNNKNNNNNNNNTFYTIYFNSTSVKKKT